MGSLAYSETPRSWGPRRFRAENPWRTACRPRTESLSRLGSVSVNPQTQSKAYRVARSIGCTAAAEILGRLAFDEDLFVTTDLATGEKRPLREEDFQRLMRFHDHIWARFRWTRVESREIPS